MNLSSDRAAQDAFYALCKTAWELGDDYAWRRLDEMLHGETGGGEE